MLHNLQALYTSHRDFDLSYPIYAQLSHECDLTQGALNPKMGDGPGLQPIHHQRKCLQLNEL